MFGSDSLAADVERWSKPTIMRWVRSQYEMHKSLLSLPKRIGQASSPLSEPALGMPTWGQKLTSRPDRVMSALPLIADIHRCRWDVRKVPEADDALSVVAHGNSTKKRLTIRTTANLPQRFRIS